jgi:hypothetical protein
MCTQPVGLEAAPGRRWIGAPEFAWPSATFLILAVGHADQARGVVAHEKKNRNAANGLPVSAATNRSREVISLFEA